MSKHHDIRQWCVNNKSQMMVLSLAFCHIGIFTFHQLSAIKNFQANTIITIWCSFQRRSHDVSVNMFFYYHVDSLHERCVVTLLEKTDPDRTGDILVLLRFGGVA